ncbi:MAG: hypothetical protein KTV16_12350 [Acidimicrobiia bacterium]|nr:hypothetical protein [Acidimicrobiia bacterium]
MFSHHECERAQSEAATGTAFVRHWMHCRMVAYDGTKMSKIPHRSDSSRRTAGAAPVAECVFGVAVIVGYVPQTLSVCGLLFAKGF